MKRLMKRYRGFHQHILVAEGKAVSFYRKCGSSARAKPLRCGCSGAKNMGSPEAVFYDGGCTCRRLRYRMTSKPLIVHCCHCRWCQRETGASFALNAMIETDRVQLLQGEVEVVDTPSNSGKGQKVARCPKCHIAVWSNYAGGGDALRFVRVGRLTNPTACRPTFTSLPRRSSPG